MFSVAFIAIVYLFVAWSTGLTRGVDRSSVGGTARFAVELIVATRWSANGTVFLSNFKREHAIVHGAEYKLPCGYSAIPLPPLHNEWDETTDVTRRPWLVTLVS